MGFTITSAVLGGTIIFNYGIMVAGESDQFDYHDNGYEGRMFVHAIILSLGIAQFVIGIWAAICCCVVNPCMCCIPKQVSYLDIARLWNASKNDGHNAAKQ